MQKKQKIILIVGIAIIVILTIILLLVPSSKKAGAPTQTQNISNSSGTASNGLPQSATNAPVPSNIAVPNEGDKNVASGVAVPQTQTAAAPGSSASFRLFNITANNNQFSPSTVIAKVGDIVSIKITAVDKNYDFTQPDNGFKQVIQKGQTKTVQFSPMATGKFTFYCESCGGPSKGPVGYLIITQ